VVSKYPSAGLQAINTQTFGDAFIHKRGSKDWGFKKNYVQVISEVLKSDQSYGTVPISELAVWIGKDRFWEDGVGIQEIVDWFIVEFEITFEERSTLFLEENQTWTQEFLISDVAPNLKSLAYRNGYPPDAPSETEGTLSRISLSNIGPAKSFELNFGERLTLIAGDNGLGKSFLLEAAWWAITGTWVSDFTTPLNLSSSSQPKIEYSVKDAGAYLLDGVGHYDRAKLIWEASSRNPTVAALSIFGKADGSFAVSDPANAIHKNMQATSAMKFSAEEVWYGKGSQINGLLRDWAKWIASGNGPEAAILKRILEVLSPEDLGILKLGKTVRIPDESRDIPTILHSYGEVPIVAASAGVKRILTLAYMIIWAWSEHLQRSKYSATPPLKQLVIIIDELEAHLHPKWQRVILPALMTLGRLLSKDLDVQIIAATHSPLVMASVEPEFDASSDALYHLYLLGKNVELEELEFQKYGDISSWLTSPIFGLSQARSKGAERVIEAAKSLQLIEDPSKTEISRVNQELKRQLAPDDAFWPRWIYFAEKNGVPV
jgi:hypothetical protein